MDKPICENECCGKELYLGEVVYLADPGIFCSCKCFLSAYGGTWAELDEEYI